jgi:hypothetical protein
VNQSLDGWEALLHIVDDRLELRLLCDINRKSLGLNALSVKLIEKSLGFGTRSG